MKKIFLLLIFTINMVLNGQAIITDPQFPVEDQAVKITFNIAEMSNTSLLGYNGTLYAHTGVYTNLSPNSWKNVIGDWGDNSVQPSLTQVGTDIYELFIENPRTFYGITNSNEHITSINIVLRSSDKTKQTEDLFIEIFAEGLNVRFVQPEVLPVYPLEGEEIKITAVSGGADTLSLFYNDELLASSTSDTIITSIVTSGTGRQWIKYIAIGTDQTLIDSTYIFVREDLVIEELPAGIETGINYIDESTAILAFFAPNKQFTYLIGDFNNWEFDPDTSLSWEFDSNYYLKLTPDSTTYWTTLMGLVPEQEYRYQFLVDGVLRIADPYADKILEEEDKFISEDTYPNLIPYPEGKTRFSVSVLETGQDNFQWGANDYIRPDKENLMVYELLVRDFIQAHDYKTLIDTLDYLENLGINAIELMPINEFEGNESWGYNPSFYFAPDKYYGPKDDLKRFIDECHKRDIAVILDIVLNHSFGRSSFVRLYSSGDFGPPTNENPWYNVTSPNPVFSWGYDFNHESQHTKELIDRINKYWLEEYKFDGFRFDFTKGFTNIPGDGGGFDQSRIDILKR
ncbi:MAG: alpha-amylase family glycosyl hydrolase, partial [Melioribacteraceae bacterium]|nr:alpha-amylase family glycosyl hydrolase [Melioribacteraceae bacterium]